MKNQKPAISVVIPAFNEEKFLPRCLEAINKQTFRDFEVIVVNNNSRDKTAEIARNFGARVINEKKQGMVPARERGFREAKGNIIARTDADTVVLPDWLEIMHRTFKKNPKVVAITGTWLSPVKKIPNKIFSDYTNFMSVKLGKLIFGHVCLLGPNMGLRKSAWEKIKVNMDDKKVHEDFDLSSHIAQIGEIRYIKNLKVIFSIRRISENPVKGLGRYLGEYPVRLVKTMYYNKSRIIKHKLK